MRMHITELFSTEELHDAFVGGYVSVQTHPEIDGLTIYNYTPAAQYEGMWNNVTTQCRGLITDIFDNVVARPFPKFLNYSEHTDKGLILPDGDPIVTEKMDGSLGIIYTYNGETAVATRGSFASDQALWANGHMHCFYPDFAQPEGVTTLVEIIYPENRIVVDYDDMEGLWLLGAIDNNTGADIPFDDIYWWDGPRTPNHGVLDVDTAVALGVDDSYDEDEGVVLCWTYPDRPSFRLKVKHPRYVELHRIVTNLTTRTVHEHLAADTFGDLLAVVPDEFHSWLRHTAFELSKEYKKIEWRAESDLTTARLRARDRYPDVGYDRATLAHYVKEATYPGLCFALEDGKDISDRIWAMIRPEREMAMILEDASNQQMG